jgi:hypothetical protein
MSDETQKDDPWVCPGYTEEHEDELIGNREGFQLLKKKIDEVLETGCTPVQNGGIEWVGLKLVAEDPRTKKPVSQGRDALNLVVVSVIVAVVMFVFIAGVMSIHSWFK